MQVLDVEIDSLLTSVKKLDIEKWGVSFALGIFVSHLDCLGELQKTQSYLGILKVIDDDIVLI